jgi:beta-barrel assembly-enhancing protease
MSHHSHLPPEVDEAIRSFIRRHKRGLRWGCLLGGLLAFLLIVGLAWGLFRGASHVKDWMSGKAPAIRLPLEWEKPLGDAALAQLCGEFRFITSRQVLDPVNRLAAPLFAGLTNSSDRFTLFVTESKEVNALALPGGTIVFHRGLLERARTAEDLQGVLAHEMAQVQKRHGVLQLAQNIGLDLAIQQRQGGESRLLDALVRDSGQLLGLKFSRNHERAADDAGWELLEQAQINPQGMVNFFSGLKAASDSEALAMALLSTHPAPQERMDRLRQKSAALGARTFRSFTQEFQALHAGLGLTLEQP